MSLAAQSFSGRVVQWQRVHGRHDLPWQNTSDPYRVWLSEVMLQQTQVATVRNYFARFVERFPDISQLAQASLDDVLGLWSGLGYYSRARNLHACAKAIATTYAGEFPRSADVLMGLPGIGRSTAAAISSLCFAERVAILDANVKRVVTRVVGYDRDLALAANERALWALASGLLPPQESAHLEMPGYTQGMMDLGAMVCLPSKPLCHQCPVRSACVAGAAGNPQDYPVRSRKIKRSSQSLWLLWAQSVRGEVFLSKRPSPGVWAGLHCLPLFDSAAELQSAVPAEWRSHLQVRAGFKHVLTHKDLHLHPWILRLPDTSLIWEPGHWVAAHAWTGLGLPAPVRKLLSGADA